MGICNVNATIPFFIPELLAPAGNLQCLHAAVNGGADAVYLGLGEFNARRNADNFTMDDLAQACDYAHLRGVRIYITLNIEILPGELDRACEFARQAYEAGADAFIVQDIGLAERLGQVLPEARLHISTQMNTHNAAGVEAAWRLGASRITLARELSLPEIANLVEVAADFGIEIATFAHGALCICYSGQCLMSSMIGGRSANRGLCAQACRLPYELHSSRSPEALDAPGEHLLSPRDLCTIDLLADYARAGVRSLKIEGRMKSADYVYAVTSVYREALDELATRAANDAAWQASDELLEATPDQHRRLAEAFSRGFTTAYVTGQRGNDIMSYGRPNNRGVFVGRAGAPKGDEVELEAEVELHVGDILEFWTNRGHFAHTVAPSELLAPRRARLHPDQRVGKGDRVFRVRDASSEFQDDEFSPRVPVSGTVSLRLGEPAYVRFEAHRPFAADGEGTCMGEAWGAEVEEARTRAVSEQDVRSHVDRLGQTPFVLDALDVELDDNVGLSFSQLHHLRSEALEQLQGQMLEAYRARGGEDQPKPSSARAAHVPSRERSCSVVAWATNPACARAAKRAGADCVYVPALNYRRGQATLAGVRQDDPDQAGYPKQCVVALPTIDHDPVGFARENQGEFDVWDYVREGRPVFVDSLGSLVRAANMGASVEVGPHVPLTNAASLALVHDMGAQRVWLSPELTLGQIDELAQASPVELGLVVIGQQELMVCEHCLLMSQGPCGEQCETCPRRGVAHHLVDRKGFEFPVITDMWGRSHLYNGIELDAVPAVADLIDIGISSIMVDTTFLSPKAAGDAVARALRSRDMAMGGQRVEAKRPNTTSGHLFRGVS